jgi:hypothetical protein
MDNELTDNKTGRVWCKACGDWHMPEAHAISHISETSTCADCGDEFTVQGRVRYCETDYVLNLVRAVPEIREKVRAALIAATPQDDKLAECVRLEKLVLAADGWTCDSCGHVFGVDDTNHGEDCDLCDSCANEARAASDPEAALIAAPPQVEIASADPNPRINRKLLVELLTKLRIDASEHGLSRDAYERAANLHVAALIAATPRKSDGVEKKCVVCGQYHGLECCVDMKHHCAPQESQRRLPLGTSDACCPHIALEIANHRCSGVCEICGRWVSRSHVCSGAESAPESEKAMTTPASQRVTVEYGRLIALIADLQDEANDNNLPRKETEAFRARKRGAAVSQNKIPCVPCRICELCVSHIGKDESNCDSMLPKCQGHTKNG